MQNKYLVTKSIFFMKTISKILTIASCLLAFNSFSQLRVSTAGTVGIGTNSPREALQIGDRFTFHDGGVKYLGYNTYFHNSYFTDLRLVNGASSSIRFGSDGNITFVSASSGSAGAGISWTTNLHISNSYKNIGIGRFPSSSYYKLYVNGRIHCESVFEYSDERLKKDIKKIVNVMDDLQKIEGKSYKFKDQKNRDNEESFGFIAQDVKKVYPNLVKEDSDSLNSMAINYTGFIPILLEAIKEQQTTIETLQTKLVDLENQINDIKLIDIHGTSDNNLNNSSLEQNFPNPFTSETAIKMNLSSDVKEALLYIYDWEGNKKMTFSIKERGEANVIISGRKLKPGIYIYTLVADGIVVGAKQMVLTK
jgi:hypothetical protein